MHTDTNTWRTQYSGAYRLTMQTYKLLYPTDGFSVANLSLEKFLLVF